MSSSKAGSGWLLKMVDAPVPEVSTQPDVVPEHWRAVEDEVGRTFLLLVVDDQGSGRVRLRVTSPIASLDRKRRMAVTQSGRRYWLECPPTVDEDLARMMRVHAELTGLAVAEDVSQEVWAMVRPPG